MNHQIRGPGLLQCSRVNVLDVRPILMEGEEPFESIEYNLSLLPEDSTLLIVTPFEPKSIKKYVRRQGFEFIDEKVNETMHWLAVYKGTSSTELEVNGPGSSYVLPTGGGGQVVFLDARNLEVERILEWIRSTLLGLEDRDLLVVHVPQWDERLQDGLNSGKLNRRSILSNHVRLEYRSSDSS